MGEFFPQGKDFSIHRKRDQNQKRVKDEMKGEEKEDEERER